jgi:hypothetical protein
MIDDAIIQRAHSIAIESVLERRGIKLRGRGNNRRGPCPRCGGRDRFAISIRKNVFNCRNCRKGGDVIDLVQFVDNLNFTGAVNALTGNYNNSKPVKHNTHNRAEAYEATQLRKAQWLWNSSEPITGTPAEIYLRDVRGYSGQLPPTLRYLPAKGSYPPAMIAAFGIPGGKIMGVHFTRLTADGRKADVETPKSFLGPSAGFPIVLAPPNDLLGLAIAEGIEDALTAHLVTGLGAWAAGCADRMPALASIIPNYVEAVTIFAHEDESGQRNAFELAEALDIRGIEVRIECQD